MGEPSTSANGEVSHEERILELAISKPQGITEKDIKQQCPNMDIEEYKTILNKFLKNGSINILKAKNGQLIYKYAGDTTKRNVLKGAECEEKVVFNIVQEAGTKGIWIRDINIKAGLNQSQSTKIIKNLENKKLIKRIRSVNKSTRKIYMLYDLEPDISLTGGSWYQGLHFEDEFVEVLSQQCLRYLKERLDEATKNGGGPLLVRNSSYASVGEVHKFIADLGISKVTLTSEDIEHILFVVVLDNHAEKHIAANGAVLYRAKTSFLATQGLFKTTCGICPISYKCGDTGLINPKACEYLNEWLS